MAKNKNRKQGSQQNRASQAERGAEQAEVVLDGVAGRAARQSQAQGSPADVARKHQKRFGHN